MGYDPSQDFRSFEYEIVNMYAGWKETRVVISVKDEEYDNDSNLHLMLDNDDSDKSLQPMLLKSPRISNNKDDEIRMLCEQHRNSSGNGIVMMALSGDDGSDNESDQIKFK